MKVYVVETGVYDGRGIAAIYLSADAAVAANPVTREPSPNHHLSIERAGGWQEHEDGSWSNGLDWDDHATITPHEVQ